ncbi:MAG: T9SS type A sorting domain-containing protein [Chitinophagaceae bacterium]
MKLNGGFVKRLSTYPNPFTSNLKLELNAEQSELVNLRISNDAGQIVLNKNISVQKGNNVIVLSSEIASLKPGVFIVEINTTNQKFVEKVVKH